ncbi:MAG TPA: hypothetical protein VHS13_00480 [Edaphobacter sp.]|jgi:hypothetical protein|nr:hypothetical protein [Edaphobacter sp.]
MAKALRDFRLTGTLSALLLLSTTLLADPARFDLVGPKVDVHVTRNNRTLPIAQVPNLLPGDKIWLHPDLPPTQSVHYLLIAAFLRGSTNPPPDNWFTEIQTWNKKIREEGVTITVPQEAQQVILFLAPETGGDFSTLRSAVRGRPGVFVRASQDLTEAGFEQARIEAYLANIRLVPPDDPKALAEHSDFLARTLNLKPNGDCFKKPLDAQANCLTQAGNQSLLDDGHGQTVAEALSNGGGTDLINQATYTGIGGGGLYSAYVGAVVDLVRLMSGLHTAKYQYIPAIAFPNGEALNLRLNTPPSFHDPKSVIVIGLPAIQAAVPPPLRPADPKAVTCLLKPSIVLPVEGAPLVFSTAFAHDLVLHLDNAGKETEVPITPDAFQGGLVLAHPPARKPLPLESIPASASNETKDEAKSNEAKPAAEGERTPNKVAPAEATTISGTVTGFWGFDPFSGPTLRLQDTPGKDWKLVSTDPLIAGKDQHVLLTATGTACLESIKLDPGPNTAFGAAKEQTFKPASGNPDKPNTVEVALSLPPHDPGTLHLAILQYGVHKPDTVSLTDYSEPAKLDALTYHAGDTTAQLAGSRLDQVQKLVLHDLTFTPTPANSNSEPATEKNLLLSLPQNFNPPQLHPGEHLTAQVSLKDGRTLTLPVTVSPSRPAVTLLSKSINPSQSDSTPIHLADENDLPADQQLTFSLKSSQPFPRAAAIEIANADESLHTSLNVASGSLILQNHNTLLATLDPLKAFGTSAFGPLRLRPVMPDGTAGDWLPLVTLVRLPTLKDLHCPADANQPCTVSGSSLYLVDSIATDPDFTTPTTVPEGFVGNTLTLPRPPKTGFFLKLRDDPTAANSVSLPILPQPPLTEH